MLPCIFGELKRIITNNKERFFIFFFVFGETSMFCNQMRTFFFQSESNECLANTLRRNKVRFQPICFNFLHNYWTNPLFLAHAKLCERKNTLDGHIYLSFTCVPNYKDGIFLVFLRHVFIYFMEKRSFSQHSAVSKSIKIFIYL